MQVRYYALLTVDLHSADSGQRAVFDSKMVERDWRKCLSVSTTYTASFKEGISVEDVSKISKEDIQFALKESKIHSVDVAMMTSSHEPMYF